MTRFLLASVLLLAATGCKSRSGVDLCERGVKDGKLYKIDDCTDKTALTHWANPDHKDEPMIGCMREALLRCNSPDYKGTHRGMVCLMPLSSGNLWTETYECNENAILHMSSIRTDGEQTTIPYR